MKRLTPKEIERLYYLVARAVEHGQLQLQAEGGTHRASDGLTYPQYFGTADLGDVAMNGDDGDPTCGVTVTVPAPTLKWLWVRVAGSMGGKTKARKSPNDQVHLPPTLKAPKLVRFWRAFVAGHRFFIRESYSYSGTAFVRHPFQWLCAYSRFMWSTVTHEWAMMRIHKAND